MSDKAFTPALGYRFLTPVYDPAISLLMREERWRSELVKLAAPEPGDRTLTSIEPRAEVLGLDPDAAVLGIARTKAAKHGLHINFENGFLDAEMVARIGVLTKIVSSLVFHQTPIDEKARILSNMRSALGDSGRLIIADYGLRRSRLMRMLFRATVQAIDGTVDTQPNADGCLPDLIRAAGFRDVKESLVVPTATGSISIYQASVV